MTNLKCSVYSCAYHKGDCCTKNDIQVSGAQACCCGETCCSSYMPRGTENAVMAPPVERLQISCNATECVYNKQSSCQASNVSINSMNGTAGCSTFVKKD